MLTEETAAIRAFNYAVLHGLAPDGNFIPRAVAALPDARRDMAERVASLDDSMAELLRKNFDVDISAATNDGVAGSTDLTPHTNAAEPMLPNHIVKVTFPGLAYELKRVADEADLNRPWPLDWAYYAVYDNRIG